MLLAFVSIASSYLTKKREMRILFLPLGHFEHVYLNINIQTPLEKLGDTCFMEIMVNP